ncbi:endonuclease/exonuclease/phosphatase family protein [Streptomyces sp. NPDC057696]|uniref:endonuclease/exonuclease/phosphatase family protein n=1 Tax=Streptomyces sp. NPDC057696 TaxID=3346218 RepID=UPI0036C490A4
MLARQILPLSPAKSWSSRRRVRRRAIALGDFNAIPSAPELSRMWAVATSTGQQCRPSPNAACEPTTDWHLTFDYVFLRGIAPRTQRVHPNPCSDHHLTQADLETNSVKQGREPGLHPQPAPRGFSAQTPTYREAP